MSFFDLCEVAEISQQLGLPFQAAVRLYKTLERPEPSFVITRRHEGCTGSLTVVI